MSRNFLKWVNCFYFKTFEFIEADGQTDEGMDETDEFPFLSKCDNASGNIGVRFLFMIDI